MFNRKAGKAILWIGLVFIVSVPLSLWFMNYTIDKVWGAHTEVVSPELFNKQQKKFAIVNVNVLSANGEHMRPNQTVLIEQGIITSVSAEPVLPVDAHFIDGSGKYLIPGLIDSHVHLWQSPNDLLLYIANGVTHVREMNGSEQHLQWKSEIEAGRPGPDMFVATRRHNSSGLFKGLFDRWTAKINRVGDVDSVATHVHTMANQGYDAVKIYTFLESEHFQAFNDAASASDLPLLGHIPVNMELSDLWQSEMKELAHTEELVKALNREFGGYTSQTAEEFLQFVRDRSTDIVTNLRNNEMAVVSTLALMQSIAPQKLNVSDTLSTVELDYVNPGIVESFHPSIRIMGWSPDVNIYRLPDNFPDERIADNQTYWNTYSRANEILLQAMAASGVLVLAGTDANVPTMVPGFSLHDELISLTQAGFSEAQALKSATFTPADWMNIKSGAIRVGYQADMLLLQANPLDDIRNTQSIDAVVNNGRWYTRTDLDDMLEAVRYANCCGR